MSNASALPRYSEVGVLVRISFMMRLLTLLTCMLGFVEQTISWATAVAVIIVMLTSMAGLGIPSVPDLLRRHPILVVLDALVMTAVMTVLGTNNPLMLLTLSSCVIVGVLLPTPATVVSTFVLVVGYVQATLSADDASRRSFTDLVGMPITFISFVVLAHSYRIIAERKRQSDRALTDLVSSAATAQERARVARELHDSTAKTLQGVALTAQSLKHWAIHDPERAAAQADDIASSAQAEVLQLRRMLKDLREEEIDQPFDESLAALVRETAMAHGVRAVLDLQPLRVGAPGVRSELLAATREAVINSATHSGSDRVSVTMSCDVEDVVITIVDAGRGFDTSLLGEREGQGHYGVRGMRERLQMIGGQACLSSTPSSGTRVTLTAPARGLREDGSR